MRKKILIIIATDVIGGPGKGIFQFLQHSGSNYFEFSIANFDRQGSESRNTHFLKKAKEIGLSVKLLRQRFTIDPILIVECMRLLKENSISLLQTHGYKANILGFSIKTLVQIPWLAFAHGYTDDNRKLNFYNRLDSFALRFADKVVSVSNPLKELLVHRGVNPSTIEVIQNAVDSKELKPDLKAEEVRGKHGILKDDIVVGVVGRLGPEKGQAIFLQALTLLKKRMVRIKALLIGDGPEKEKLIKYCHDHELIDYVIFTGYQENIANYYQIMDLLVIPSFSEGLPNVLLEAMAMGIPVVATAVGGITEVVEKTSGELVTAGNVEEMSRSIELLIMDEKLRYSMSKKARTKVLSLFSTENRANQIINLYQNILSKAPCY